MDKVKKIWFTIATWFQENYPKAISNFNPPATHEMIADAEIKLGYTLPDDYKEFLLIHNGQNEFAPMVELCPLVPVEQLTNLVGRLFVAMGDDEELAKAPFDRETTAVMPTIFSPGWIPFAVSSSGRTYLCLDMTPGPTGKKGQILFLHSDSSKVSVISDSFADFLRLYLDELQSGEIEID